MTVPRGEVFGSLGPNGAGKTTAVKLLLGLVKPTGGEGWLLGAPVGDVPTRRRVGYLPELFRYQPWLTGREVMGVHCRLARLPRSQWRGGSERCLRLGRLGGPQGGPAGPPSAGVQRAVG